MARDYEVGARLTLKNLAQFRAGMKGAAESVDDVGDQARQSSRSLAAMSKLSRGVGRTAMVGLRYGAIGAATAIAGIGAAGIKSQIESERSWAQTDAVIKSTGGAANVTRGQIEKLATGIQGMSGIEDEVTAKGANLLLTFTNIKNAAGEGNDVFNQTVKTMSDMGAALGQDAKASAIQLGKALNDPIKGVTALSRVGVSFTEQQKEQIATLVESGRTMDAQKLILGELNKEFGGSAKAMGKTTEGQFNILKSTVGDALEKVGAAILPVVNKLMPALTDSIVPVLEKMAPVFGKLAETLGDVLPGLLNAAAPLLTVFAEAFGAIGNALAPVLEMLGPIFTRIIGILLPVIKPLVQMLGDGLLQVIEALAPSLPDIATSFVKILTALMPLIPVIAQLISLFASVAGPVVAKLAEGIAWLVEKGLVPFINAIVNLKDTWDTIWHGVKRIAENVWNAITTGIKSFVNTAIIGPINWIIEKLNAIQIHIHIDPPIGPTIDFNWNGIGLPTIPKLQHGGPAMAGQAHWVGEGGRELFVPSMSGTVIPERQVHAMEGFSQKSEPKIVQLVVDRKVLAQVLLDEHDTQGARA